MSHLKRPKSEEEKKIDYIYVFEPEHMSDVTSEAGSDQC